MLITGFSTFLLPLRELQRKLTSYWYFFISERHGIEILETFTHTYENSSLNQNVFSMRSSKFTNFEQMKKQIP
jgi:hypothetical protein